MTKHKSLMGQRFGRLVAVRKVFAPGHGIKYLCYCDCGTSKNVLATNLSKGNSQSCGCLHREIINQPISHGMSRTNPYAVWSMMIQRCENPSNKSYVNYGGRGIRVCERWRSSYEQFRADMGDCPPGLSLDRINNGGDYSPENCRWANISQQARNRTNNRILECGGKRQCLAAWAIEIGIERRSIMSRLKRGWSVEKALTTPLQIQKHPRPVSQTGV